MSEQLREAMASLADESTPAPVAADTWRRARRARRRDGALTGVAAVLALVLLAISATSLVSGLTRPPVASQDAPGALPDRVSIPSPAESVVGEGDAFDSVALLSFVGGARSPVAGEAAPQPFVLGATTGAYRYVDLPGLVPAQVAVSADGTTVVWPVAGDGGVATQALRVWEPESGAVHDVDLGPETEPLRAVCVSADGTLASGAQDDAALVVDLTTGAVLDRRAPSVPVGWTGDDAALVVERGRLLGWAVSGAVSELGPWSGAPVPVVPSPKGRYLLPAPGGEGLAVADPSSDRAPRPLPSDGPVRSTAVGWVDERTVVLTNRGGGGALGRSTGLVTADVRTGEVGPWVKVPRALMTGGRLLVAGAAVARPPYEAAEAGGRWGRGWPTLALVVGLLLLVVVGRAFISWRWPDPPQADLREIHQQQAG